MNENPPSLLEINSTLPLPLVRTVNFDNPREPGIVHINREVTTQLEQTIPYDELLRAAQEAEQIGIERKVHAGVRYLGCGDAGNALIIQGGSFAHVLEHALIQILDRHVDPHEQSIGSTVVDGVLPWDGLSDPLKIDHSYRIMIAPPPSLEPIVVQDLIPSLIKRIEAQVQESGKINLADITFETKNYTSIRKLQLKARRLVKR